MSKLIILLLFLSSTIWASENFAQQTEKEQLFQAYQINKKVNKVRYVTDMENYGVEEYFSTLEEFYKKGGDCEEYSLAKYEELRKLGFPINKMWIIAGMYKGEGHSMLLIELSNGKEYLLDNNSEKPISTNMTTFKPYYKYNSINIWTFNNHSFGSYNEGKYSNEDRHKLMKVFKENI